MTFSFTTITFLLLFASAVKYKNTTLPNILQFLACELDTAFANNLISIGF